MSSINFKPKSRVYSVSVGNIGNIKCNSLEDAVETFDTYVQMSKDASGRGAGEDVFIFQDEEVLQEYYAPIWKKTSDGYEHKATSGLKILLDQAGTEKGGTKVYFITFDGEKIIEDSHSLDCAKECGNEYFDLIL